MVAAIRQHIPIVFTPETGAGYLHVSPLLNVASPMGAALVDGRLNLVGGQHCSPLSEGWLAQPPCLD